VHERLLAYANHYLFFKIDTKDFIVKKVAHFVPCFSFVSADQTPTPTKFLRNCEEMGLFNELSKNPFEEAFKKAADESKNLDLPEVSFQVFLR
jgi:hypothetical protein